MYGVINKSLKEMVIEQFGMERWESVLSRSGVPADSFLSMRSYDDERTYALAHACADELQIPLPDAQAELILFEPQKVEALVKDLGLEVVRKLVKKFLTESAERWNALEKGVAAEETATISRESHTLGSSCVTFGIVGAGQHFRQIEAQINAGETITMSALGAIEQPLVIGIQNLEARLRDEA